MHLAVDPDAAQPPFEQVRSQITEQVRSGQVPPGTRLPPVRALAQELGLAANTVARAYRELEHSGVVETREGTARSSAPPTRCTTARRWPPRQPSRDARASSASTTRPPLGWPRAALAQAR